MNKIIRALEKHCNSDDILFTLYGIKSDEHYDFAIIAPSWEIDKVFDKSKFKYKLIYEDRFSVSHLLKVNGKKILYTSLHIGAPNMSDFCLACYKMNCENFIFIGSAGCIKKDIHIGDIIIPTNAINANGASLYLFDKLSGDNFLEETQTNSALTKTLEKEFFKNNINFKTEKVISIDSILAEYAHIKEFLKLNASVVEMELATFLKCMQIIKKRAAAVLVISDNSVNGEHLIGKSEKQSNKYHNMRPIIAEILSKLDI